MADYQLPITNGTMMIRDLGYEVQFWFKTGPSTWNNDQWWSWGANGTGSRQKFRLLRGGDWQLFGSTNVAYDQTIRFTIEASGLGWGTTDFFQAIPRSTTPSAPTMTYCAAISESAVHVEFVGNYDGGSAILEYQIGYGTSIGIGPTYFTDSDGSDDIGLLSSGTTWYFWARGRNSLGWGAWSNRGEATTFALPSPPGPAVVLDLRQKSMIIQYVYGYASPDLLERQLGYGTSPTAPTSFANDPSGINTVTGLTAGGTYYVWGRARNSVGWGAWSVRTRVDLIAGALVLVGGVWKRAVPYVRDGGTWKVAEPWARNAGTWTRSM